MCTISARLVFSSFPVNRCLVYINHQCLFAPVPEIGKFSKRKLDFQTRNENKFNNECVALFLLVLSSGTCKCIQFEVKQPAVCDTTSICIHIRGCHLLHPYMHTMQYKVLEWIYFTCLLSVFLWSYIIKTMIPLSAYEKTWFCTSKIFPWFSNKTTLAISAHFASRTSVFERSDFFLFHNFSVILKTNVEHRELFSNSIRFKLEFNKELFRGEFFSVVPSWVTSRQFNSECVTFFLLFPFKW